MNNDVDVSYKKVGDGHPLRLWKCTIDVEAPPNEVLNRVLNERYCFYLSSISACFPEFAEFITRIHFFCCQNKLWSQHQSEKFGHNTSLKSLVTAPV